MPKLTKNLADTLFRGYGPFSTFAAKIDVLFAMGFLSDALRRDLNAIKAMRNNFAHPAQMIIDNDNIILAMKKFSDFKLNHDVFGFFGKKARECIDAIDEVLSSMSSAHNEQPDTSPRR
jgi:DNA-binding MltR family transcriptional regulator